MTLNGTIHCAVAIICANVWAAVGHIGLSVLWLAWAIAILVVEAVIRRSMRTESEPEPS